MNEERQRKSVDRFFRDEYQKLVRFVRKTLENRFMGSSPEDIVQDVALGLIDRFDPDVQIVNLSAYIYRSLRNRVIDDSRRKEVTISIEKFADKRNGSNLLDIIPEEPADESNVYGDTSPELLREAIAQLRPDEQALIIATEFENRPYDELSEEWEVPVGTLLSRKHRALGKLLKILTNNKNDQNGNTGK